MVPRLHVVTDDAVIARSSFVTTASEVLTALGPRGALHIRGHTTPGRRLFEIVAALRIVAERAGAPLVVNDRLDVARSAHVHAIQLGPKSFTPDEARRIIPGAQVGLSVHAAEKPRQNEPRQSADWLIAGHVFDTSSHAGEPARGLAFLRTVVERTAAPVIAVGGIHVDDVATVRATGAYGVAVIRGIWDAPGGTAVAAVAQFLDALES